MSGLLLVACFGCGSPSPPAKVLAVDVEPAPVRTNLSKPTPAVANAEPKSSALPEMPGNKSVPEEIGADGVVGKFTVPLAGGYRSVELQTSPRIADLISQARAAMAQRDLLTANQLLQRSPPKDRGANDALELERLWLMSRLLAKFWSSVHEATGALAVGIRFEINDLIATVTAIELGEVSLKFADGTEKRYLLLPTTIPVELAEALARRGLEDSGAVTNRMVVAFHLLDREGNRERAAVLCRELDQAGLNIDLFLPEL